jgi:hypothetical protein
MIKDTDKTKPIMAERDGSASSLGAAPAAASASDPAVTELAAHLIAEKQRSSSANDDVPAAKPSLRDKLAATVHKAASYTSFAPMIVFACVPDIRVAAVVACAIAIFNASVSALLYRIGLLRVFPRIFDLVNVAIYVTLVAVAETHPKWTNLWAPLFTSGLTALYFAGSLIVRRPFTHDLAKESAPEFFWDNGAFKRLNVHISLAWAVALWVVTLAAVAYGVIYTVGGGPSPKAYLLLDVVLGIAPLVLAVVAQHALVWRFRRGVRAEVLRLMHERGSAGAQAV